MKVTCEICPKACVIGPGESGDCRIRVNIDGTLRAVTYGYPSAVHVDPIEKKPMNHFLPGTGAFSIATVGCNLHCKNCQNWDISQRNPEEAKAFPLPPERVPELARQYGCQSVAYTYTEPAVYYEYALDSCIRVHEAGLKNVLVTAGYMNDRPMRELYAHVDGATIDVKALSDTFYREICDATLAPILRTLVTAKSMGVVVEVSNLVIPTLNDSDKAIGDLCRWIKENMGGETPFHFLGFHPTYRMQHLPPTSAETLVRAREIALAAGLQFVYVGNVLADGAGDTCCPKCREVLIRRVGHRLTRNRVRGGRCPDCGAEIYGLWQ